MVIDRDKEVKREEKIQDSVMWQEPNENIWGKMAHYSGQTQWKLKNGLWNWY